jgi:hypothetical protein
MPFEKGHPKYEGSGRKAGVPNKVTSAVKEAIEQAFSELGGVTYLKRVAEEDMKAFCTLLGRVLPKDVQIGGVDGAPIRILIVTGVPPKDEPETPKEPDADPGS